MDMRIPSLTNKIMIESKPLKSRMLVWALAVCVQMCSTRLGGFLAPPSAWSMSVLDLYGARERRAELLLLLLLMIIMIIMMMIIISMISILLNNNDNNNNNNNAYNSNSKPQRQALHSAGNPKPRCFRLPKEPSCYVLLLQTREFHYEYYYYHWY